MEQAMETHDRKPAKLVRTRVNLEKKRYRTSPNSISNFGTKLLSIFWTKDLSSLDSILLSL